MKRLRALASIVLSLLLFVLAVWAIDQELKHYTIAQLGASLANISSWDKLIAIFLTMLSYLSMTGYDWLGFRYINRSLALPKIIRASFISYALGNTIGFSLFSGTAIRYRFYSPAGLSTIEIAKVITFTHLSFWVGMLAIGGLNFLLSPLALPRLLKFPFHTARPLGLIFLGLVGSYYLLTLFYPKKIQIANETIAIPSFPLSLSLLLVASLDWPLAAGVLYVLLPDSYTVSYVEFFGLYLFAMTAGVVSSVPGGVGVFELLMLKLRPDTVSKPDLLGALIAYRCIYYFLPLIVALALLIGYEIHQKTRH